MKALIVYDSVFGNTAQVAQSIGSALGCQEGDIVKVNDVRPEQLKGIDILIVGSPTRAFRPTPAITTFVKSLPSTTMQGMKVAAFDTRMSAADANSGFLNFMIKLFGYAAEPIAKGLIKKGGSQVIPPAGFLVKASEGPLKDGELERATGWAQKVLAPG